MTDHPIIKADFVKPQPVPSRKVLQLVFEVPEEQADHAMAVLGGYPQSGENRWCAIAQLNPEITPAMIGREAIAQLAEDGAGNKEQPSEATTERVKGGLLARHAGILCHDPMFHAFVKRWQPRTWHDLMADHSHPAAAAAQYVRDICGIESRAELDHNEAAADEFREIEHAFHSAKEGRTEEDQQRQREAGRT